MDMISEKHGVDIRKVQVKESQVVFLGIDTRESSPSLRDAMIAGIKALNVRVHDFGFSTTPQIHWLVSHYNETQEILDTAAFNDIWAKKLNDFFNLAKGEKSNY